jgi:hypothetical protein
MTQSIRKTTAADLDAVMGIYAYARAVMAASGNPGQWGEAHPPRELVEDDINKGLSYVCECGGRIEAVFCFEEADEPTYARIDGEWLNDAPYGVVHRIARAPKARKARERRAWIGAWHNAATSASTPTKPTPP